MNKKIILVFAILFVMGLFFWPKYSGFGQKCSCIGFKQNKIDKDYFDIYDPKTFKPLIEGKETVTTICYGIPYQCKVSEGFKVLDPSFNTK